MKKSLFLLAAGCLLLAGCAAPNTVVLKSDDQGRWTKTVYSKSYISEKIELAEGLFVVITGYDEGRVNPFAAALGALGPEAQTPPVSFVAHFRNDTSEPISVEPVSLRVAEETYPLEPKWIALGSQEIQGTQKVMGTCSVLSRTIETEIKVIYGSEKISRSIVLHQETLEELNARMRRHKDNLVQD